MNYTIYTEKEKLAHLERAQAARERGTASFRSYADAVGISRSTFYKWVHAHGYGDDKPIKKEKPVMAFVNLGKPSQKRACLEQRFVVAFCGSKIEVSLPNSLLALLKLALYSS
jgi:transposase-like protein